MHSRLYTKIGVLGLIALTAGCVQATRHSNTMIFGTNTNVGVKVGQNVNQLPEILIGYDRQEAVIMPLWANTLDHREGNNGNLLSPCPSEGFEDEQAVHPCAFVASRQKDNNSYAQDSYSVLASFGAQIEGNGSGTEAQVGLAQYFATGMAAQILALTGGASIVSVGKAAEKAAETAPAAANAIPALLGGDFGTNTAAGEQAAQNTLDKEMGIRGRLVMPWKCGDPATDNANFIKILTDANAKLPDPTWLGFIGTATTKDEAENFLISSSFELQDQFLKSQNSIC